MTTPKNEKRVAAGKRSRRKGSGNELALAKLFKTWWGHGEWARTPLSGGWATKDAREGFRTCGDVITTAKDFPFCAEAKKQEGWTVDQLVHNEKSILLKWWKQAVDETPVGQMPLLLASRNFVPQLVIFEPTWLTAVARNERWPGWPATDTALPCRPWEHFRHLVCNTAITDTLSSGWVLMSLDDFFKMDPTHFGRRQDVQRTEEPAGAPTAERPAERA